MTATLNGAAFTSGSAVTTEGYHTIVVQAKDAVQRTTTKTINFRVDATPPVISVYGVTDGGTNNSNVSPSFQAQDMTPTTVTAKLDGANFTSGAAVTTEGPHTLVVTATDAAGFTSTKTVSWRIDKTPPVVTVSVTANAVVQPGTAITYSATDQTLTTLTATMDGVAFASGGTLTASGSHTIVVQAKDAANWTTTKTVTFTIAVGAPTITINGVTNNAVVANNVTLTFSATGAAPITVTGKLDGATFTSGSTVSTEGAHTLVVTAVDSGNRTSTKSVAFLLDKTPPVVTVNGVNDGQLLGTAPTVTFSAADLTATTVTATLDDTAFTSGSSVTADGAHTLVVTATDATPRTTTKNVRFTVDRTSPVLSVSGVADGATVAGPVTLTFSATDLTATTVTATLDGAPSRQAPRCRAPVRISSLSPRPTP
jgi:hypothetical protein